MCTAENGRLNLKDGDVLLWLTPNALGDPNQLAKSIIDIAAGEKLDRARPGIKRNRPGALLHSGGKQFGAIWLSCSPFPGIAWPF